MGFFKEEDYTLVMIPRHVWVPKYKEISEWLLTLPDEDYEYSKAHLGNPGVGRGMYFRHEADIITFKLKFGI